jgi:hypothetical protein
MVMDRFSSTPTLGVLTSVTIHQAFKDKYNADSRLVRSLAMVLQEKDRSRY